MTTGSTELSAAKRRLLEQMLRGEGVPGGEAVTARPAGSTAPMTPEQGQVWLHAAMAPEQPLYNEPIVIHRRGSFDLRLLEASFNEILRRHEIWRTAFELVDGELVLAPRGELRVRLPLTDLTALPEADREAEALRLFTEVARAPMDLAKAPPLRAEVFKLADDDHRLHLTLHHIVFDGVSLYRVLVPELAAIYAAYEEGRVPDLPEPKLQYGDYAVWRGRQVEGAAVRGQLGYWRERLAGLPVLELATDRPRPPMLSYRGSMEKFALSPRLTEALKALSRGEGTTLYATLLTAFQTLLHRYTGQEDLVVGGLTDARPRPELQQLMGYFLNTFVLRSQPSGELSFRDYLTATRQVVLEAMANSDVPFDRVVRELEPRRDPSCHPLFQVMFSIQPPAEFPAGWDLTQMDVTMGISKFDLFLEMEERPDTVIGRFLYSTDLFDASTVRRMIGHWTTLLEAVAADPGRKLADLPLLTEPERDQLLVAWNGTARPGRSTTLHGWIEAQVRRTPDKVAVAYEERTLTYAELDARAGRLAARLRQEGVGRERLVAVCVERSLDMVVALLAVLKAGGAYLPLDPQVPPARLQALIEDAGPLLVLAQAAFAGTLGGAGARVLPLELALEEAEELSPETAAVDPEDLAYVLYTSGSTGRPKAVEVPHRAVTNLLSALQRTPGFGPDDVMLAVARLTFDQSVGELYLPLVTGARLVVAPRDTVADPARLMRLIEQSGATVMPATPTTWRALVEEGWPGSARLRLFCGGEALAPDLAERLLPRCAELWNMYGPTEATVYTVIHKVVRGEGQAPIGRPIDNARVYILDRYGAPAPVGTAGELHIAGGGLARGYRNRVDLTDERFVTVPTLPGERLYRTGDVARWRPDGEIEYLGRRDDQVKIRGFRIELGEVEAALESCPGVAAAAVKTWPDPAGGLSLTAYLVGRDGTTPDVAEVRRAVRELLPDYMAPAQLMVLPALPMTTSGKVDRKALPEAERGASAVVFVEPSGDRERKLAAIWRDVLGVRRIGAGDNFFDLGGHSILVARLLRKVEQEFGARLSMAAMFHAPDLRQMAALLDGGAATARLPRTVKLQPKGSRPPLFWLNAGPIFRPLAEAMGPDQPVIGVPFESDELHALGERFELQDAAAYMVEVVRSTQASGPYHLGGWCAWGVLAYEAAQQLAAAGQEVGVTLMLDAPQPLHIHRLGGAAIEASKVKHHWSQLLRRRGRERWSYLGERVDNAFGRIRRALWDPAPVGEASRFGELLGRAVYRYSPRPYAGDVALFQPIDRPQVLDYRAGWAEVVQGELITYDLPGDHNTVLKAPHVQALGQAMSACLAQARPAAALQKIAG